MYVFRRRVREHVHVYLYTLLYVFICTCTNTQLSRYNTLLFTTAPMHCLVWHCSVLFLVISFEAFEVDFVTTRLSLWRLLQEYRTCWLALTAAC